MLEVSSGSWCECLRVYDLSVSVYCGFVLSFDEVSVASFSDHDCVAVSACSTERSSSRFFS